MITEEKILDIVYNAIDSVNELLSSEQQIQKSPEEALSGGTASLDSLNLVNLIVATEQKLEETYGINLDLANEQALAMENNPFSTIGSLVSYIKMLLEGASK